ncbi:hypothetical protein ACROYT_G015113 [Oculina patagonica]
MTTLFAAAKKVIAVDFFNSRVLDGSCILLAGLSRLRHLTLSGTSVTDQILSRILRASSELVELHLTGTRISELCLPDIIGLRKLKYIAFPPEDVCGFSKGGVLLVVKKCPSLRTLDCQEGYFLVQEDISEIVSNNPQLTGLIIPYAFVDDNTMEFMVDSLKNLTYQHLLNSIKDTMRGGHYKPSCILITMKNIDDYVADNSPIVDKYLVKYDEKFTP